MEAPAQRTGVTTYGAEDRALTYEDWVQLNQGDRVLVQRPGHTPQQGTVDDVSEDATYFWTWLDGHGRVLIYDGDGSVISRL
jgi:hypothetical protein